MPQQKKQPPVQQSNAEKMRWRSIFSALAAANPNPKSDLEFTNPFELFVATLLSAQAQDKVVNRVTRVLFQTIKCPKDVIEYGQKSLQAALQTIGLAPTKAKNLLQSCLLLEKKFAGVVPKNRGDLESLPGIGRKSAGVILHLGFQQTTFPVDTHVRRVSQRLNLTTENHPDKIEQELLKKTPKDFLFHGHAWLVLHGRYVCTAKKPQCSGCLLLSFCPTGKKAIKTPKKS